MTHAGTEPERWRVTIALPSGDVDALRMALPGALPRERYGLITELRPEGEEGDTDLSVEAVARTRQGAIEVAVEAYERARELARLPRDAAEVLGVLPPMFSGSVHALLREEAEHLLDRGQCELAVVRAHTACECLAREAIEAVLRVRLEAPHRQHSAESLMRIVGSSLSNARTQRLLKDLTGGTFAVTQQAWWASYALHVKRRNAIVHHGVFVEPADARESLEAVDACMSWLRELWEKG